MGIYLDRIKNLSENTPDLNLSLTPKTDYITDMIQVSNTATSGYLGLGVLTLTWFTIYNQISSPNSNFQITKTQALISTCTLTFTISIYLILTGVLVSSQHFVWVALLNFIAFTIGVFRFE